MSIEQKKWIDDASYVSLLRRWRNDASGGTIFQGEAGDYYIKAMKAKREEVGDDAHVAASKAIGWNG